MKMNENEIYNALGLEPEQAENAGAAAENVPSADGGGADTSVPTKGEGVNGAVERVAALSPEEAESGDAAEDKGADLAAGQSRAAGADEPKGAAEESDDGAAGEQTPEERREHAARRRRQEQDRAIREAVEAALAEQKKLDEQKWSDFFRRAKLKNTMTGEQINSFEEFGAWADAFEAEQMQRELQEGKLTPETLKRVIADNPTVRRAEELLRREENERRAREDAAAAKRIEAEIAEISKLDPSIRSTADLLNMPRAQEFYEYVRRGNSFLDAFYLVNRERLAAQAAEAAKQQTLSSVRSREHLTATGSGRGAGAQGVPADELAMFRLFNPDASEEDIQRFYNSENGKKNGQE